MGCLIFIDVTPQVPDPPIHTITLDFDGAVTVQCPGVRAACAVLVECDCYETDDTFDDTEPPSEFDAHGVRHETAEWTDDYVVPSDECWMAFSFERDPERVGRFIAEVSGVPSIYPAHISDDPAYLLNANADTYYLESAPLASSGTLAAAH